MILGEVDRVRGRIAVLWLYHLLKKPEWAWLNRSDENYTQLVNTLDAAIRAGRYGMTRSHTGDSVYDFLGQLNSTAPQVTIPLPNYFVYPSTTCFDFDWALEIGMNILRYWLVASRGTSQSSLRRHAGQIAQALGVPIVDILELLEHVLIGHLRKELARE